MRGRRETRRMGRCLSGFADAAGRRGVSLLQLKRHIAAGATLCGGLVEPLFHFGTGHHAGTIHHVWRFCPPANSRPRAYRKTHHGWYFDCDG